MSSLRPQKWVVVAVPAFSVIGVYEQYSQARASARAEAKANGQMYIVVPAHFVAGSWE